MYKDDLFTKPKTMTKTETSIAHQNAGIVFLNKRQYNDSINSLSLAIQINSHHYPSFITMGDVLFTLTRFKDALEYQDKAIHVQENVRNSSNHYENQNELFDIKLDVDSANSSIVTAKNILGDVTESKIQELNTNLEKQKELSINNVREINKTGIQNIQQLHIQPGRLTKVIILINQIIMPLESFMKFNDWKQCQQVIKDSKWFIDRLIESIDSLVFNSDQFKERFENVEQYQDIYFSKDEDLIIPKELSNFLNQVQDFMNLYKKCKLLNNIQSKQKHQTSVIENALELKRKANDKQNKYIKKHSIKSNLTELTAQIKQFTLEKAEIISKRAKTLYELGRKREALEAYSYSAELDPSQYLIHYQKGLLYHEQHNYDEAIQSQTHCIDLNDQFIDAMISKTIAQYDIKNYSCALKEIRNILILNESIPKVYQWNAKTLLKLEGDLDAALVNVNKAIDLDPTDVLYKELYRKINKKISDQQDQSVKEFNYTTMSKKKRLFSSTKNITKNFNNQEPELYGKGLNTSDKIYTEKVQSMQDLIQNINVKDIEFLKNLKNPDQKIKQFFYVLLRLFTDVEIESSPKSDKFGNIDLSMNSVMKLMKNPVKFIYDIRDLAKMVPNGKVKYDNFVKAWNIIEEEDLTDDLFRKKCKAATFIFAGVREICKIGLLQKK